MNDLIYHATKTAAAFHCDNSRVRLQMGPVGCGKSVSSCLEIPRRAKEQAPGSDGIRRTRFAVIRNTYPELKATTIKTWQEWFPENVFGAIKWDSPIYHRLRFDDVDCEVIFLALDSPTDIKKLMSFELTGAYINELQFIPKAIFDICLQRINRYPAKVSGASITWAGIIADTNPPDTDHWIYKLFEEGKPEGYRLFRYQPALRIVKEIPPGVPYATSLNGTHYILNAEADYVRCQNDPHYWLNLVSGYTDEQIKVYLQGKYGIVIEGKAVHPEYNDVLHFTTKNYVVNRELDIGLGWDFGLTPACAIVQLTADGQLVVLDELYSDDMSLRDFAEYRVIPHLNRHYPHWQEHYVSRHDPAGQTGSQTDGKSCQQILSDLKINSEPAASSNAPTPRRDGLKYFLRRLINGQPGFLLTMNCKRLRKALMGSYQYARLRGADERYHEKPLKNAYSHIAEALEYIAMYYAQKPHDSQQQAIKDLVSRYWSFPETYGGARML